MASDVATFLQARCRLEMDARRRLLQGPVSVTFSVGNTVASPRNSRGSSPLKLNKTNGINVVLVPIKSAAGVVVIRYCALPRGRTTLVNCHLVSTSSTVKCIPLGASQRYDN